MIWDGVGSGRSLLRADANELTVTAIASIVEGVALAAAVLTTVSRAVAVDNSNGCWIGMMVEYMTAKGSAAIGLEESKGLAVGSGVSTGVMDVAKDDCNVAATLPVELQADPEIVVVPCWAVLADHMQPKGLL